MVAGHFGFAAIVKSRERPTPLWALMLACQWMDVVFVPLFALGIERIEFAPGTTGGYGNAIIHADYTHSLAGALVLAASFGWVASLRYGKRSGWVLGLVVFSHWLLDLVVHRPDLPLLPGNAGNLPLLGFGLWRVPAATIAVELALVTAGGVLYWRAAVSTARAADGRSLRRAHLAGAVALLSGFATLATDALGF
jgi:hypothetical protein